MTEDDKERFIDLMRDVCAYYATDLTEFLVNVWWNVLHVYSFDAVKAATTRYIALPDTGTFFPKVSDVVKLLGGTAMDNAQLAWTKVVRAVRQVGGHMSICFDDGIINSVIADMGGWVALCNTLSDDSMPFKAREFETRYRAAALRGLTSWPRYLTGRIEQANGTEYAAHTPPAILFGDRVKAELVWDKGATGVGHNFELPRPIASH
jgi:hypothetical protein